jgi:hypothetical protein
MRKLLYLKTKERGVSLPVNASAAGVSVATQANPLEPAFLRGGGPPVASARRAVYDLSSLREDRLREDI